MDIKEITYLLTLDEQPDPLGSTEIDNALLVESEQRKIMGHLEGDKKLMNYLFLFEQLLNQHSVYLFKGWEDAQIVKPPKVENFWITFWLRVDAGVDLRGVKRLRGSIPQSKITSRKMSDDRRLITFQILKSDLDKIEKDNEVKISKLVQDGED